MKRLTIYLTPGHASVTIQNGVSRETSADTLPKVIDGMPVEDRQTLRTFAAHLLAYCEGATVNHTEGLLVK